MMKPFTIGVMIDSFRLPPREGVRKAREVGADGIQINVARGEMSPERMGVSARTEFKALCAYLGLEVAALCGDLGGHGFERAEENAMKVERSKRIIDMAADLGTDVVTTHVGVIPEDPCAETYQTVLAACKNIADYAQEKGVTFAIETGPEKATVLKQFLDDVASSGIGVNFDPANLVMVVADDPVRAVYILKDYIVHTHAKDGVQLQPCDPVLVYNTFANGGLEGLDIDALFNEVPLGEGSVDFDAYLAALVDIGYSGFLTIEREVGDDPYADIKKAVGFLRKKIAEIS